MEFILEIILTVLEEIFNLKKETIILRIRRIPNKAVRGLIKFLIIAIPCVLVILLYAACGYLLYAH